MLKVLDWYWSSETMQVNEAIGDAVKDELVDKKTNHAFCFPFPPYDIQVDLMNSMTRVMDESLIGIMESPTGTGKTLSIICSSLSWLKKHRDDNKRKTQQQLESLIRQLKQLETSSDWISSHGRKRQLQDQQSILIKDKEVFEWKEKRDDELKTRKDKKLMSVDLQLKVGNKLKRKLEEDELFSDFDVNLVDDDEEVDPNDLFNEDTQDEKTVQPKIFYACRTHSQLSQFVNEVKKTTFSSQDNVRVVSLGSRANLCTNSAVNNSRNVSLINDRCLFMMKSKSKTVKKKKGLEENPFFVNEVAESNSKSGNTCIGKCSYLTPRAVHELKEDILSKVQDIEEVYESGKQQESCGFYASRSAVKEADLVVLPYNLLLHPKARDSYGITLDKNSIVIIDEAHNLLETITSLHSSEVSLEQMIRCFFQLSSYITKYEKRFNPNNLFFMRQLETFLKNVIKFMRSQDNTSSSHGKVFSTTDFRVSASIENINLFKLMDFLDRSQLARKLFGFSSTRIDRPQTKVLLKQDNNDVQFERNDGQSKDLTSTAKDVSNKGGTTSLLSRIQEKKKMEKQNKNKKSTSMTKAMNSKPDSKETQKTETTKETSSQSNPSSSNESSVSSPLYVIQDLIKCLLNPTPDGRVIVSKTTSQEPSNVSLRYFLLNASDHFKDVVTQSRCIILAGGTMKPFEEFTQLLFKPMKIEGLEDRILTFSCGHVIPAKNVLCLSLSHGGNNKHLPLNYSFSSRSCNQLLDETGQVLMSLSKVIRGGIVLFFPSYDYLELMYQRWESTNIIQQIQAQGKKVFKEPKSASLVSKILNDYEKMNNNERSGGILLSVVGGKVSEGINFNDNMCRCVVVIGMPYANSTSPALKEKMDFFDRVLGQGKGRFYYENLCFKAINQSIGRSIRHKDDYSVILLLDERYSKRETQVRSSLPTWIGQTLETGMTYEEAEKNIKDFFREKKAVYN